ncbi:MAG: DUF349 domain-containing protein [Tannerellaceae bacterium]|jgi:ribosome-associated translation inhibitor RaiA|nr:DUF349 domain-containing protein [Tannerellaceae bacterium]
MMDTQETNLPAEEQGELEEAKDAAITPEAAEEEAAVEQNTVTEEATEEAEGSIDVADSAAEEPDSDAPESPSHVSHTKLTKEEILDKMADLVNSGAELSARNGVEQLKNAFYKIHRLEVDELKKAFVEGGGDENDFHAPLDEAEAKLKRILNIYKEKKSRQHAEDEQKRKANYALKLQLIERIKELIESQDDFNKLYNEFKEIQQRWKEIKSVPQEHSNELWRSYQVYSERFYDLIKINNQLRDYDFKKNMEAKTSVCERLEKLAEEPDTVHAFHQYQKLHLLWREIGPVSKELRADIWARYKAASTVINKRYQEHFGNIKVIEQDNLEAKIALCEEIESIDYSLIKTYKDWEAKSAEVIAAQGKWRHIGFASKSHGVKVFERFRAACDLFFNSRMEFNKRMKQMWDDNLALKTALCERAEALKDSTDWRDATDEMISLQKEWRTIGPVPRKLSDSTWKRFISACDHFFEQKNKNVSSQKTVEQSNLLIKREIIETINKIDDSLEHGPALAQIRECTEKWNATGFVPFKDKDSILTEYQEALDRQFDRLKVNRDDRKMQTFRSNLGDMTGGEKGKGKLYGERDKLMRTYERMKSELQTYENNIGFLSISSKGGGSLLKEMERRIDSIREEMALIIKKIDAIDENLE